MLNYTDVVRIYEKDLTRRLIVFCSMSVLAVIFGIGFNSLLLASSSTVLAVGLGVLCFNGGGFKFGFPRRMSVLRSAHPTDKHTSLWEIEYHGYRAPIELSNLESLRSRHNLNEVSDD